MEKILVSLEVPAIESSFEVMIPPALPIGELAAVLGKSVEDMTEGRYLSSGEEFLCVRERDAVLRDSQTARDYGIQNGEHLLLL